MITELYRHWAADGTLLYVGISKSTAARLAQHASHSHWFSQVASVTIERYGSRAEAEDAERTAIRKERPRYNVIHGTAVNRIAFRAELARRGWTTKGKGLGSDFGFDVNSRIRAFLEKCRYECTCGKGVDDCECEHSQARVWPGRRFWDWELYEAAGEFNLIWLLRDPDAWRFKVEQWGHPVIVLEVAYADPIAALAGSKLEEDVRLLHLQLDGTDAWHMRAYASDEYGRAVPWVEDVIELECAA